MRERLERAKGFYDAAFAALGRAPGEVDDRGRLIDARAGGRPMITAPIDGRPATPTDGGTIGLGAARRAHVPAWHATGAALGGLAIERPPTERPNGSFAAYLRDPDDKAHSTDPADRVRRASATWPRAGRSSDISTDAAQR